MKKPSTILCTLTAGIIAMTAAPPARADHPALVFAAVVMIDAGIFLGAAVVASSIIVAAAILDDDNGGQGGETETRGEDAEEGGPQGSGDGPGEGGDNPGGAPVVGAGSQSGPTFHSQRIAIASNGAPAATQFDNGSTHPRVSGFIDRGGSMAIHAQEQDRVRLEGAYRFDGNVARAPQSLDRFRHSESLAFRLKLDSSKITDPKSCVRLSLADLVASTEEIPRTDGSVSVSIDVFERGRKALSHTLTVRTGRESQRPNWLGAGAKAEKNRITVPAAEISIPCTPDRSGKPIDLTVAINMQMVGERI